MGEWHRFQLIQVLDPTQVDPVGGYSWAKAACVDWNQFTGQYYLTGDYITVHDWQGRHYGLPGECGWARCTDAHWPEVVDLGGLFRRGKLDDNLVSGGSALVSIWEDQGSGESLDTGQNVPAYDFMLPDDGFLLKGSKVDVRYSELSELWYVVNPAKPPILLGKNADADITNNATGTITVYSVPSGGSQGSETKFDPAQTFTALNKTFGIIPKNTWVFAECNDDGWYIVATEQGDHLVGRIKPEISSSTVNLNVPPLTTASWYLKGSLIQVDVEICPSDQGVIQDSSVTATVQAAVRHRPMLNGESVVVVWTGSIFTIVAGQFDGGVLCYNGGNNVAKGAAVGDMVVRLDLTGSMTPSTGPALSQTNGRVFSPLGLWSSQKMGWLSWNAGGGVITAAECQGRVQRPSVDSVEPVVSHYDSMPASRACNAATIGRCS